MLSRFKSKTIFRIVYVAVAVLAAVAVSQAETLPFKNYTTADGLGHDRVDEIIRDTRGFLWFCTGEGLSRFDGYEFKNYTQADGLPHRRVMDLIEIGYGKYLVATYGGLAVFDPLGESRRWDDVASRTETPSDSTGPPMFRVLRPPDSTQPKRSWTVMDLLKDRDGRIWVATLDGLFRLEQLGDDWNFHRVESDLFSGKNLEFITLLEDRFGALWIATTGGLFRQTPDGKIGLLDRLIGGSSMLEDSSGRVWIGGGSGTKGLQVAVFPDGQNKPVLERVYTMNDGLTANDWINDILETSDGRILIGSGNGLSEFLSGATGASPKFRTISKVDVVVLNEDGGGNIWIGTSANGVSKLSRGGFTLFDEDDLQRQAQAFFSSIFSGEGSDVFFSESANNLVRFDGRAFTFVKPLQMTGRSWGWNQIDLRSRTGEWWIGSDDKVLRYPSVRFEDLANTKPIATYVYTQPGATRRNSFFRLFEDSRGDVWMALIGDPQDTSGISFLRWDRATDTLHAYSPSEHDIPYGNGPTAFAEDRAGGVWLGYYFGGLVLYRNGKFRTLTAEDGMPSGIVNAIYNDSSGRIWIATGSNGIVRVDDPTDERPRLVNLTVADGLSSNQAACLAEDNFGSIYVGTGRGVTRLDPATGRIKIYSRADGLSHSYVRVCGRDGSGGLWFSQDKILARLIPKAVGTTAPPPIFIGDLRVNGDRFKKLSELGEEVVEDLELDSDQRQIQIEFFALGFGTGETLRYQYKLDNSDWSDLGTQRTVNLNFSPGSYNVLVRAVNAEGVPSEIPARVSFAIARPFWQQWWFLLAVASGVSLLSYFFYRNRLAHAITLERVRTRLATDLHDDIGSSLSQIAILSEVARHKVGDKGAAEPLIRIADTSRDMVDSMSDIVWAINPQKDRLGDLIHRMRRFASDTFDATDVGYTFHFDETAGDIAVGADLRREIYLIFKECINNAAKYSRAERVDISIDVSNDHIAVIVDDKGCGFDVAAMSAGGFDGYGGNGLMNMRKRAVALGGEFEIGSEPGRGTVVRFRMPTGRTRSGRRRKAES